MNMPTRSITDVEIARAKAHLVDEIELNRAEVAIILDAFKYPELEPAKALIKESGSQLTVGDVYQVWCAVSDALDAHNGENQEELKDLESDCAGIVTAAWDDEMKLSDRALRQQNVTNTYHTPLPQPAPDSVALMLKKICGSLEWVALAIFVLAIVQCSSDQPKATAQASGVGMTAVDVPALVQSIEESIKNLPIEDKTAFDLSHINLKNEGCVLTKDGKPLQLEDSKTGERVLIPKGTLIPSQCFERPSQPCEVKVGQNGEKPYLLCPDATSN